MCPPGASEFVDLRKTYGPVKQCASSWCPPPWKSWCASYTTGCICQVHESTRAGLTPLFQFSFSLFLYPFWNRSYHFNSWITLWMPNLQILSYTNTSFSKISYNFVVLPRCFPHPLCHHVGVCRPASVLPWGQLRSVLQSRTNHLLEGYPNVQRQVAKNKNVLGIARVYDTFRVGIIQASLSDASPVTPGNFYSRHRIPERHQRQWI